MECAFTSDVGVFSDGKVLRTIMSACHKLLLSKHHSCDSIFVSRGTPCNVDIMMPPGFKENLQGEGAAPTGKSLATAFSLPAVRKHMPYAINWINECRLASTHTDVKWSTSRYASPEFGNTYYCSERRQMMLVGLLRRRKRPPRLRQPDHRILYADDTQMRDLLTLQGTACSTRH